MAKKKPTDRILEIEQATINVGLAFDQIKSDDEKWYALIMLLTGFFIESIKPCQYEEAMKDLSKDALENIMEFAKRKGGRLADVPPEGNA